MAKLLFILAFLSIAVEIAVCQKKLVCYYRYCSDARTVSRLLPEDIDPDLCTHIVFSYTKIVNATLVPNCVDRLSNELDNGVFYKELSNLRTKNPNLKILLGVGGKESSTGFKDLVNNELHWILFAGHSIDYMQTNKFDGLVLDWKYPSSSDKILYRRFIQFLKPIYQKYSLLFTASVPAVKSIIDEAYQVREICRELDFVNILAFDFHDYRDGVTGHNAPLYARIDELGDKRLLNVDFATTYLISQGCPSSKLILGLAAYGRSFKLKDPTQNGLGAPAPGIPTPGFYTKEIGLLSYYEVCMRKNFTFEMNVESLVPYRYNDTDWVGYDDKNSIEMKVDYAKSMGLGGVMIWALDLDDYNGSFCGEKFPLTNTAKTVLFDIITTTLPPTPGTTNTGLCLNGDGNYLKEGTDCKEYYTCSNFGTPNFSITDQTCPGDLIFDIVMMDCNLEALTVC